MNTSTSFSRKIKESRWVSWAHKWLFDPEPDVQILVVPKGSGTSVEQPGLASHHIDETG